MPCANAILARSAGLPASQTKRPAFVIAPGVCMILYLAGYQLFGRECDPRVMWCLYGLYRLAAVGLVIVMIGAVILTKPIRGERILTELINLYIIHM